MIRGYLDVFFGDFGIRFVVMMVRDFVDVGGKGSTAGGQGV